MYNLFTNFPIISYDGNAAVNVLAKVKFTKIAQNINAIFYPYTIAEGERPDIIAANYYDDPRYSWVIYMANDIIDPYYDWPLTEEEFKRFINKKYGSTENANREIAYWEDNWYADETTLSIAAYESLSADRKKYFKPNVGMRGNVINYSRNQLNLVVETNKTIEISVANSAGFAAEEYITQNTSGTLSASGFIKAISDNNIVVQNVLGTFANTAGSVSNLISSKSNSTSAVSNVTTINTSIPVDEQAYWTYVTKYDYESQLNEQKRFIRLIDKSFIDQIEKELGDLL